MATIDYSIVPAVVTITNIATPKEAFDAGTKPDAEGKKEITAVRRFQFFKTNSYCVLEPADELKVIARTSAELNYFMSLDDGENFKVTAAKQS